MNPDFSWGKNPCCLTPAHEYLLYRNFLIPVPNSRHLAQVQPPLCQLLQVSQWYYSLEVSYRARLVNRMPTLPTPPYISTYTNTNIWRPSLNGQHIVLLPRATAPLYLRISKHFLYSGGTFILQDRTYTCFERNLFLRVRTCQRNGT